MNGRMLALFAACALGAGAPAEASERPASTGTLTGVVTDATRHEAIAGAAVWLEIIEGACPTTRAETDAGGRYRFADLVPGRYRVRASRTGYVTHYHGEGDQPSFGSEIVMMPGERRSADVSLAAAAEISGHVRDGDGRPMARGYVFFDNLSFTNRSFHAMTDGEGYYRVADLPPGDYRVSARRYSPGAHQVVGERWFHPGTIDEREAEAVTLAAGSPAQVDLFFGREPAPTWSVRVRGPAGEPVARAEIGLRSPSGKSDSPLSCRTDADGRCARALPPGEYEAYLALAPAAYGAGGEGALPRRFHVEQGMTALTEFRLRPGLSLTGVIRTRDGDRPPADHALRFTLARPLPRSRGESDRRVESRPEGDDGFAFEGLAAGVAFRLEVSSRDPHRRYCVSALAMGDAPLDPARVLVPEEPASTLAVEISRCAVLLGHAADGAGAIALRRVGGPPLPEPLHPREQRTEPSGGRFAFRGLPAGRYVVERPAAAPVELVLQVGEVRALPER